MEAIVEPRFFETERGYQGELLAELRARLHDIGLPDDPVIEQEYQKRLREHGLTIRPDLIVHIPFDRGATQDRRDGNFVAIEIKRDRNKVREAFASLAAIERALDYALTILIVVDSAETFAEQCPPDIARKTVCFAARLEDGRPVVRMHECG
jgi:hypothetical protein